MNESIIIINTIAIILGPIIAVIVTLIYQNYKAKRNDREHLFKVLMVNRKAYPPDREWIKALNVIPIYFANNKKILSMWYQYYNLLNETGDNIDKMRGHAYLELLSGIALSLGYKNLQQTDIDKYYFPKIIESESQKINELFDDLLRIAQNTERLLLEKKKDI